jgi:HK97 family phage portal protein
MVFNRILEQRGISFQTLFASGDSIDIGNLSGTVMNAEAAFQVNAIFSAVSLISDLVSTLPVDAHINEDGTRLPFRPKPSWVDQPDIDFPRQAFYSAIVVSLLLEGSAFVRVFSNRKGEVVNLTVLNPSHVEIVRNGIGRLQFNVVGEDAPLSGDDIVYIPDLLRPGQIRGVSRIIALKENFGLALALERFYANFMGSGTQLSGVIEYPNNLTQEQADNLRTGFDSRHSGWSRSNRTGVLSGGATFKPTQIDPQQSSLIESRHMAVEDIARAFNIPPHLLGLPGTMSYSSVEENNRSFLITTVAPLVSKLEAALTPLMKRSPGGENAYIKFNMDALLRANVQARTAAYSSGLQAGYLTINDVRRLEDLYPVEDSAADTVRVPLANVTITDSGLTAEEKRVRMANVLVLSGYDPAESLAAVGLDPIAHTGLASTQLQPVSQIDPTDPNAVYADEVK